MKLSYYHSNPKVVCKHLLAFSCLMASLVAQKAGAGSQWWDNNKASAATSGTWDTTTANWSATSALAASTTVFTNGNFAEFAAGTTAISNLTITVNSAVSCAGLATGLAGATVTNLTFSGTGSITLVTNGGALINGNYYQGFYCGPSGLGIITVTVPITGAGGIQQHSSGSLALNATNTFSGGVALTGGQLIDYNNNSSFGTGPIYVGGSGNALVSGIVAALTIPNNFVFPTAGYALNLAGGTPVGGFPGTTFTGTFSLPAGTTLLETSSTAAMQMEIAGVISGVGANLAVGDIGTLILANTNIYTGNTTISNGTVQVAAPETPGTSGPLGNPATPANSILFSGGTLQFSPSNTFDYSSRFSSASTSYKIDVNGQQVTLASALGGGVALTNYSTAAGGVLTLSGLNTYSGGTTITNSAVVANSLSDSGGSLGLGAVNLARATLYYTGTGDTTYRTFNGTSATTNIIDVPTGVTLNLAGQVKGTATFYINKTSPGTLEFSGTADNAFLGMNVQAGTVILNVASSPGSVRAIGEATMVSSGATLQLSGSGGAEINNNVPLTISSGGLFDLNSQSDTIGSLSLTGTGISASGALINSAVSTVSSLTCPIALGANTTVGGSGSIMLPGVVGGFGQSLTYVGTGTLTLSAINTYTGGTFVSSGILDGNAAGSIPGNVTISGTGALELDSPTAMSSVATLDLPSSPATNTVFLNFSGTEPIGILMLGSTAMPAGTYGAVGSGATYQSATFSGTGILSVSTVYWDANGSDALAQTNSAGGGSGNWDNSTADWWVATNADTSWPFDGLAFFAGTPGTVTLAASVNADGLVFTVPGYTVTNTDGVSILTLDGDNPTITLPAGNTAIGCTIAESGGGPVVFNGTGTLNLSGTNVYSGGTTINGASLILNNISDSGPSSIGNSGDVVFFGGGSISYTGGGAAITGRNISANSGSTAVTSYINVPAGSLEVDGELRSGLVTGSSGQFFTKTGAGTLIMGGSVDNSGLGMAINQGEVIITKSSAATVHGLGGTLSTVGNGTVGNSAELQLSGSGNSDLYSGCTIMVNSPDGVIDLNGQNDNFSTLTLSGSGPTGAGALINTASGTTSTLTNGGSAVVLAGPTTIGGTGNIKLVSKVSGGNSITYAGTGTLTLTNANTYSGGTVINPGATVLLTNGAASGGTGAITDNGTLDVGIVGNNATLANAISGPGVVNLFETTSENLQLGGSMSGFTGTINCPASASTAKAQILTTAVALSSSATINVAAGGTLYAANAGVTIPCPININGTGNSEVYGSLRIENGALISGPVTLYGNTTMGNNQSGAAKLATVSGPISQSNGTFGITFTAVPGTIVLSGTNTFGGGLLISGGVLQIGGAGSLGAGNYAANITNNASFTYSSSASQTLSGVISGTGLLTQSGSGPLTLTDANTYTGNTVIASGHTLIIGGAGGLGNGPPGNIYAGNITNSGTFNYSSSAAQTLSGVVSGTGALVENGPGKLTLGAVDTYSGATTVATGATLMLTGSSSINNTSALNLAAGATFDVSAFGLSYSLGGGTTLKAGGTGTNSGSTAASIIGSSNGTVSVGSLVLNFTPQTYNGDTNHPALYVPQGTLNLSGTGITISNAAPTPMGPGTYNLVQVQSGSISVASTNFTVTGSGLAAGSAASLSVSGGDLNLVVVNAVVPTPVINSVTTSGGNLVFSGTNGQNGGTYYVLTSTNAASPLANWTSIATNTFSTNGTFSFTQAIGAEPARFFIIEIPAP